MSKKRPPFEIERIKKKVNTGTKEKPFWTADSEDKYLKIFGITIGKISEQVIFLEQSN